MTNDLEETIVVTFQQLDACLLAATEIAPVTNPHELLDLLPECSPPARRLILAEMVKFDMAQAADSGFLRTLSFYDEILEPQYDEGQIPIDLVLEEIQIRRMCGEFPVEMDYRDRFPHLREIVAEFLVKQLPRQTLGRVAKAPVFAPGQTVDDFQIVRTLGQGAFASVYLARQISIQRLVALKVSQHGSDEPIALSQLDHANVVRLYDQRRITDPDAILLYMQYVPGGTLAETIKATSESTLEQLSGAALLSNVDAALLKAGQQVPENSTEREQLADLDWPRVVAWLGVQLAEGLAAAHERGIMHRDVKPANILLTSAGVPKLADFNVSYGGENSGAGAAVHFGGSLAYMSPEQLEVANPRACKRAEDLDERSDLYSLAIVLWEVWHGRRPVQPSDMFDSWSNALEQQSAMRRELPRPIRQVNTAAARVLDKTLRHALVEDRELRPRTGREFAGRLRLALNTQAAEYFEPDSRSWRAWILRLRVLVVTAVIIFVPNGLAGALNYQYNFHSVSRNYPALTEFFEDLSFAINFVAFPIGALLVVLIVRPLQLALWRARDDKPAREKDLDAAWNLGHRAATIGGTLWAIAGIIFPLALKIAEPTFTLSSSVEFFLSLVICGGFAWIYPFFGISLVGTKIYYPSLVAPTMVDSKLTERAERIKARATNYLATAAAIPLAALGLLALTSKVDAGNQTFLLAIVALTAVALPIAFAAHQRILDSCQTLQSVLGQFRAAK